MSSLFFIFLFAYTYCTINRYISDEGVNQGDCTEKPGCATLKYVFSKLTKDDYEVILVSKKHLNITENLVFKTDRTLIIQSVGVVEKPFLNFQGGSLRIISHLKYENSRVGGFIITDTGECGENKRHFLIRLDKGDLQDCVVAAVEPKKCHSYDKFYIKAERLYGVTFQGLSDWNYNVFVETGYIQDSLFVNSTNDQFDMNLFGNNTSLHSCTFDGIALLSFSNVVTYLRDCHFKNSLLELNQESFFDVDSSTFSADSRFLILEKSSIAIKQSLCEHMIVDDGSAFVIDHSSITIRDSEINSINNEKSVIELKDDSIAIINDVTIKNITGGSLFSIKDSQLSVRESEFYDLDRIPLFIDCACSDTGTSAIHFDSETLLEPYINPLKCDLRCTLNDNYCSVFYHQHKTTDYSWVIGIILIVLALFFFIGAIIAYIVFTYFKKKIYNKLLYEELGDLVSSSEEEDE